MCLSLKSSSLFIGLLLTISLATGLETEDGFDFTDSELSSVEDIDYLSGGGMIRAYDEEDRSPADFWTGAIVQFDNQNGSSREVEVEILHIDDNQDSTNSVEVVESENISLNEGHFEQKRISRGLEGTKESIDLFENYSYLGLRVDDKIISNSLVELDMEDTIGHITRGTTEEFGKKYSEFEPQPGSRTARLGEESTYTRIIPSYRCEDRCLKAPYKLKVDGEIILEKDRFEAGNYRGIKPTRNTSEVDLDELDPGSYMMDVWVSKPSLPDGFLRSTRINLEEPLPDADVSYSSITDYTEKQTVYITFEFHEAGTYNVTSKIGEEVVMEDSLSLESEQEVEKEVKAVQPGEMVTLIEADKEDWKSLDSNQNISEERTNVVPAERIYTSMGDKVEVDATDHIVEVSGGGDFRVRSIFATQSGGEGLTVDWLSSDESTNLGNGQSWWHPNRDYKLKLCDMGRGEDNMRDGTFALADPDSVSDIEDELNKICGSESEEVEYLDYSLGDEIKLEEDEGIEFNNNIMILDSISSSEEKIVVYENIERDSNSINVVEGESNNLHEDYSVHLCSLNTDSARLSVTERDIDNSEACLDEDIERNHFEISETEIEKGQSIEVDIQASEQVAGNGYKIVFDGPEEISKEFYEQQVSHSFTPEAAGEYTISMVPDSGLIGNLIGSLLGQDSLHERQINVIDGETEEWITYCSEEGYEALSLDGKISCIEQEIVPKYFEDSAGSQPEIAQNLCQDLLGYNYNQQNQNCVP